MSIKAKAISIMSLTAILLITVIYTITNIIFTQNISNQEIYSINQDFKRVKLHIEDTISSLNSTVIDWSIWDATYQYVKDGNRDYIISTNLDTSALSNLKLNFMIFTDTYQKIVFMNVYDSINSEDLALDDNIQKLIKSDPLLSNTTSPDNIISGILTINGRYTLVSSHPILKSDYSGPAAGNLIIGRFIDKDELKTMQLLTNSKIALLSLSDVLSNSATDNITKDLHGNQTPTHIISSGKTSNAYILFKDIYGKPALVFNLKIPRTVYLNGMSNLRLLTILFFIGSLIIFITSILFMVKFITSKLEHLNSFITQLTKTGDISKRIKISGADEISLLASTMNLLLNELELAGDEIHQREKQLNLVLEGTNDGFCDLNLKTWRSFFSLRWMDISGFSYKELDGALNAWKNLIHPEDLSVFEKALINNLEGVTDFLRVQYRIKTKNQSWKWVLHRGKVVEWDENKIPLRMTGTISDIDEQKQNESEIEYLTLYDKLTGLHNRVFCEAELNKLILENSIPFSIIMGDLNGLKITNDIFGHFEGDRLLQITSDILRKSCRKGDIIARWGGDEYVIILWNTDEEASSLVCTRIRQLCESIENTPVKPSIALGSATKSTPEQDIYDILNEAEKRMYRNKLLESKSARSAIIASLIKSLAEKSHETEEHTFRIQELCIRIGCKVKLLDYQLDQLALLATLHDIGKIAIPNDILEYPGKLSPEQWEIMKTHSEIGYRIAESTPELNHIAEAILYHHERYDGTGYPKGLKGDEIPVISRILSIVDTFDVMTHARAYKEPMSIETAFSELINCCGTQFDPHLVNIFIQMVIEIN